ncbi:MAG: sigma-70 family RNA polymerase sigma factor [candidate division NC10 bacterium]|nr:sigma-70 family RNA polymerase sigma factor [candidate division NC10 bacterium]
MNDKEKNHEPAEESGEQLQTEARLIQQAKEGDQRAFEALLKLHDRRVFVLIGSFIRRRQDVEDLAQDVFLKAYLALGGFRPGAPFAPWLKRIAVNTCYDHLRKIRRRPEMALDDLAVSEKMYLAAGGGSDDRVAARDLAERVLATLPPKDRLAITLREVQGLEIAEIAHALGCTRPAAKVRLFRARRAMQATLQRLIRQEEQMGNRSRRREQNEVS